jgi:hypothetical protein
MRLNLFATKQQIWGNSNALIQTPDLWGRVLKKDGDSKINCYPQRDYQKEIRALSCMFRIGTEVPEIFDVPVEIADPVRLRLLLGNAKLA